jgi:hypothetical protein
VPIAGVVVVLAGSAPAAAAASAVDVVPALTSTPFGAAPGQSVKHTITLSTTGTGRVTAVRVTFTTTVGLDDVRASVSPGRCPTVTAQNVVCELGNVDISTAAAPEVTITGTVQSATAPGALVQNLVNVTSQQPDADPDNNVVSNAYLVPGGTRTPGESTSDPNAASQPTGKQAWTASNSVSVIAVLALGALAAASLIFVWRRQRQQ